VARKPAWEQRQGSSRSGVLTTAGNLVFQASGSNFIAFRADTGAQLWTTDAQTGIVAGAASYELDGTQYVAVVAGQSGFGGSYWTPNYARLLVYKLGGTAILPEKAAFTPPALNPPPEFGDTALRARGETRYNEHCASCHGNSGRVSSLFPDLRYAAALTSPELFKSIVIDGIFEANGMVSFREQLSADDAEAIRAYVVYLANEEKRNPTPQFPFGARRGPPAPAAPAPAVDEKPASNQDAELHE
jgi:mono/diheme cytochrome c family protein